MTTLLLGFDSAWTPTNSGALVGVVRAEDGTYRELGEPKVVNYSAAEDTILEWQRQENPAATIVMLDQPTIVRNSSGQRPVENLVASPVSRRYGGTQPANTAREEMFGTGAPVWTFLARFGGPADPRKPVEDTCVFETYPVLAMIALGWTLPDSRRPTGRLPKYNPERHTFSIFDWRHVCLRVASEFAARQLSKLVGWLNGAAENPSPRKSNQDGVDACICLLVALHLAELRESLLVENTDTGYIVVPFGHALSAELQARCKRTDRRHGEWVHSLVLGGKCMALAEPSNTTFDRTAGSHALAAASQNDRWADTGSNA